MPEEPTPPQQRSAFGTLFLAAIAAFIYWYGNGFNPFSAVLIAAIIVVIIMPHESGGSPP